MVAAKIVGGMPPVEKVGWGGEWPPFTSPTPLPPPIVNNDTPVEHAVQRWQKQFIAHTEPSYGGAIHNCGLLRHLIIAPQLPQVFNSILHQVISR